MPPILLGTLHIGDYKLIKGRKKLLIEIFGTIAVIILWSIFTSGLHVFKQSILPSPYSVVTSFKSLIVDDALIGNILYSVKLNLLGLLEAVAMALPVGLFIGLVPPLRAFCERYLTAIRFLPLTGVVGLFVSMFGIGMNMKVQFLAFSIFLYLLPEIIAKVDQVEDVYKQTAMTLGASKWEIIWTVYVPLVVSRGIDSIRVLAALSWTYIVVAEMVDSNAGGIGAMSYVFGLKAITAKVYATLLTILAIGYIQDKFILLIDKLSYPYKYIRRGDQ